MNTPSIKRLNVHYTSLQAMYWACYGTVWAFMSTLLLDRGFTNTQIGMVSATALLSVSLIFQPYMSALADRSSRFTSRRFSLLLMLIATAAILLMWQIPSRPISAVCYVIVGVCLLAVAPFFNAMAMALVVQGIPVNFGMARGIGSGFYGLAALGMGFVTAHFAPSMILPIGAGLALILLLLIFFFHYEGNEATALDKSNILGNLALLHKYPVFCLTLVGAALLMSSHGSTCTYMLHIVAKTGASKSAVGVALGIGAVVEVPAMALFSYFRRRFSLRTILRVCALGFLARNVLFLSATSLSVVYLTVVLQFFECGLFIPATVYCAAELVDSANLVKAQSMIHLAAHGIGSALGILISGRLIDYAGINGMLIFTCCCTALGVLIIFVVTHVASFAAHKPANA